jgi:hypothetical protein
MQEGIAVLSSDKNSLFLNTTVRKKSDFIYWFPLELTNQATPVIRKNQREGNM